MKHSEALDTLADALAKAQGQMEGASKSSANPFFKSKYADLASVWTACRKALSDNNLAVVQTPRVDVVSNEAQALSEAIKQGSLPPAVTVTTILMHNSGQWIEEELTMWPRENTPQAIGSCISYARRYALAAMVGVYQEDDDAESAEGRRIQDRDSTVTYDRANEQQVDGLQDVVSALKALDSAQLRRVWNDLNMNGQVNVVWKVLNTKQKALARELLQITGSPQPAATTTTEENDNEVEGTNEEDEGGTDDQRR